MSRYCDHFACTKDLLDRFLTAARSPEEPGRAVNELVNGLYPYRGLLHHQINHFWEDIHRCLTFDFTDSMDFEWGDHPLMLCIHGGEWFDFGRHYQTMTLLNADELPDLCAALETIDESFFRRTMRELGAEGVGRYAEDTRIDSHAETVFGDFRSLREFYKKANAAQLPVICTISH